MNKSIFEQTFLGYCKSIHKVTDTVGLTRIFEPPVAPIIPIALAGELILLFLNLNKLFSKLINYYKWKFFQYFRRKPQLQHNIIPKSFRRKL